MAEETKKPIPVLEQYYADEQQRKSFVKNIFDKGAGDYNRIDRLMAFGTGPWYRRQALLRAGLEPGMKVLDVAAGTGLVTREIVRITGDHESVFALDPSTGMLAEAHRDLPVTVIQGRGEQLPFPDDYFDFLSMGYALRHLSDLGVVFREFSRVLKPGGRFLLLEITKPDSRLKAGFLKLYMKGAVPLVTRIATKHADSALMMSWYWDTIENCIAPQEVLDSLTESGFTDVDRSLVLGIFSEYTGKNSGRLSGA